MMPTVLITRAAHQVEPLKSQLEMLGFQTLLQPAVIFRPPENWNEADSAVEKLRNGKFDWVVFTSSNGVNFFYDRYPKVTENIRVAVTGGGTNQTLLNRSGRSADLIPEIFDAEHIAKHLTAEAQQGKRFLVFRANRGQDILKRKLQEAGGKVTEVVLYQSVDVETAKPEIAISVQKKQTDYAVVTSSAIACSLVKMFGDNLRTVKLVSISPLTSATLSELGFPPQYEAKEASIDGIVKVFEEAGSG